mgnify:CR=1 FL=1
MPAKDIIHRQIIGHLPAISAWFESQSLDFQYPVYTSYDIRDSGFKVAVVDANIYPAGFNNICPVDRKNAPALLSLYLDRHYGPELKDLLLLTEEHTHNTYYWQNVKALQKIILATGKNLKIAIPTDFAGPVMRVAADGTEIEVHSAQRSEKGVRIGDFVPQLIISNNDFSNSYESWSDGLIWPMNPPRELGWYRRKKSCYFDQYNEVVSEFAKLIEVDPWLLQVETKNFVDFDLSVTEKREALAGQVDGMLKRLSEKYNQHGIQEEPFVVVKNNSGTYGLAVMKVHRGEEILNFNYKSRKKMKAAKGGGEVSEVIVQEGISSVVAADGVVAEPAIYMLGCGLAGGFLRAHSEKGPQDSLNSPGAVYKRMCVSDLQVSVEGHPMEKVCGWDARIGLLAVGREARQMNVEYLGYRQ